MGQYQYKAFTAEGATLDGVVSAQSERDAARQLERRGLSVVSVVPAGAAAPRRAGARHAKLRQRDLIIAFHELATLLAAGVGLGENTAAAIITRWGEKRCAR